mmetsp:Transcript_67647/g.100289  ORF Transcript_67647/g.100289 Transcript_67647/m.100289 type:complete len:100 (+) Transcript_67647:679-978(+)
MQYFTNSSGSSHGIPLDEVELRFRYSLLNSGEGFAAPASAIFISAEVVYLLVVAIMQEIYFNALPVLAAYVSCIPCAVFDIADAIFCCALEQFIHSVQR